MDSISFYSGNSSVRLFDFSGIGTEDDETFENTINIKELSAFKSGLIEYTSLGTTISIFLEWDGWS